MTSIETPILPLIAHSAIAARVREELAARRWFHLDEQLDIAGFSAVLDRLGTVSRNMEVVVSADREQAQREARRNNLPRPSIYQAAAMGFHTDPPPAEILAFHCVTQDDLNGASLLIDLGRIAADFTSGEIDGLCRIHVASSVINAAGVDEQVLIPLLTRHPDGPTINYTPWGVRRHEDPWLSDLLDKFECYIRERPIVSIRLKPGESLFIDNHRVLHGRGPLASNSKRLLLRVHVCSGHA
jgi:hypothetical protein